MNKQRLYQYHLEKFGVEEFPTCYSLIENWQHFVECVIQDYDKLMGMTTHKPTADMDERLKKLLTPVEELEKLL